MPTPVYTVCRSSIHSKSTGRRLGPDWRNVPSLRVDRFHPASSDHRPVVQAKMVYDDRGLYGLFRVKDRYVVCTHTEYMTHVYKDSCVEFFVKPKPDRGYFNFEMSCGGGLLLYYISDWTRIVNPDDPDDEFKEFVKVPREIGTQVRICPSLPGRVFPEIADEVEWTLEFHIPYAVLETYVGALGDLCGQEWRANFNKCADDSTHPHWASWASIGEDLNLHQPDRFGVLRFV